MNDTQNAYFLLLNSRLDRVREAKSLTLVQFELIKEKKYDEMTANFSERDELMKKFGQDSEKIEEIEKTGLELSESGKKQAEEIKLSTDRVLEEIRNKNAELRELITNRMTDCGEEIRNLRENERSANAYYAYGAKGVSMHFDKKG